MQVSKRFLIIPAVAFGFVVLVLIGYKFDWTGFSALSIEAGVTSQKRLWDWLDLLLVPAILAVGGFLLENSRRRRDLEREEEHQRQEVLNKFFDRSFELLSEHNGNLPNWARDVFRTSTLSALSQLDGDRKAQVLQFLFELGLVGKNPVVHLIGADFSGAILDNATLLGCELRGINFKGATFRSADLTNADLRGSNFSGSVFSGSVTEGARFRQAELHNAIDLIEPDLET